MSRVGEVDGWDHKQRLEFVKQTSLEESVNLFVACSKGRPNDNGHTLRIENTDTAGDYLAGVVVETDVVVVA